MLQRLGEGTPLTLVYRKLAGYDGHAALSAYPSIPNSPPTSPGPRTPSLCPLDVHAYVSWAVLEGVAAAQVFYHNDGPYCRGVLIHYDHGGVRALGECRLHVDTAKWVSQPRRVCFRLGVSNLRRYREEREEREVPTVELEFGDDTSHQHHQAEEGWHCRPLGGVLKFWFLRRRSFVEISHEVE